MSVKRTTVHTSFFMAAAPLFLVLFIDGMGLGLIYPILNDLIMEPNSHFFAYNMSSSMRNLLFGTTVGVFMFCWFFGAAFLGDYSDQVGRKKSLMICLMGAAIGYFMTALGVLSKSFIILLLGRVVAGFTSGSQPIAQAAIVDLSSADHKSRNIGFILLALSLGFILGPLIGGLLSNSALVSWFNDTTPFYFATFVSIINALLLWCLFHETFEAKIKKKIKLHRAIEIFISAFQYQRVKKLSLVFFVMEFGWASYYSFISMFLLKNFQFSITQISIYMALLGVGFGVGTGILVDYFTHRSSLKNVTIIGIVVATFAVLITAVAHRSEAIWLTVVPIGASLALAYSVMLTIFSNQVDQNSQGWVMGITGSIGALTFGLSGLLVSFLADLSVKLPMYIAFFSLWTSVLLLWPYRETKAQPIAVH